MWRRGARGGCCTFGWSGRSSVAPRIGPGRAAGASRRGSPRRARARGRVLAPERRLRRPPDGRDQRVLPRSRLRLAPRALCAAGHRTARRAARRDADVRGADRQAGPAPRPRGQHVVDGPHRRRRALRAGFRLRGGRGRHQRRRHGARGRGVGAHRRRRALRRVPAALRVRGRAGARPVHGAAGGRARHQLPGRALVADHALAGADGGRAHRARPAGRPQPAPAGAVRRLHPPRRAQQAGRVGRGRADGDGELTDAEPARAGRPRGPAGVRPLRDAPSLDRR